MTAPMERLTACALLLLLMAGCSRPPEPPEPPEPQRSGRSTPAQLEPAAPAAAPFTPGSNCADRSEKVPSADVGSLRVRAGICQGFIHADGTTITFRLPPALSEPAVRAALRVEGVSSPQLTFRQTAAESYLSVRLPAGAPGEELQVVLEGPLAEGGAPLTLGFRLKRLVTPQVSTAVRIDGGEWQPLQPGATLPRKPLELRFSLVGGPRPDRVEFAVKQALGQKGHTRSWTDESHLLVSIPEPPPALFFPFDWLEAAQGLNVQRSSICFYTGQTSPQLVALDPAAGTERVVGELPVDVLSTSLSPDGNWAALIAIQPNANEREQVWMVNTRTGERYLTEFTAGPFSKQVYWLAGGRMLLPVPGWLQVWDLNSRTGRRYESASHNWGPLSPDRRYLAGSEVDLDREDPASWLAPGSVVLFDLTEMKERVYPDITRALVPHKSVPPSLSLVWVDDARLGFTEILTHDPKSFVTTSRRLVLSLADGKVNESPALPEQKELRAPPESAAGWSYEATGWGEITLRSPDGQAVSAGAGLVIGWNVGGQLLLIRWENYPYRRLTEGI